jgi:opacity protein-like surface antigen
MKSSLVVISSVAMLLLAATLCAAQRRGTVQITPVGGPYGSTVPLSYPILCIDADNPPPTCYESKYSPLFGARMTFWVARSFGVEGSLLVSPQSFDNPGLGSIRGLATFAPASRLRAYAVGGLALVSFHADRGPSFFASPASGVGYGSKLGGVLGVGTYFQIAPSLGLRAEYERYLYSEDQLSGHRNAFMTLGLSFALRGEEGKASRIGPAWDRLARSSVHQ